MNEKTATVEEARLRRVEGHHGLHWICDCEEFTHPQRGSMGPWCWHVEYLVTPEEHWREVTREHVRRMRAKSAHG